MADPEVREAILKRRDERLTKGMSVPPFCACFTFNDWPAGIVSPVSGCIAAGAAANEVTLCAALKKAIEASPT